jgi:hypothetical protein
MSRLAGDDIIKKVMGLSKSLNESRNRPYIIRMHHGWLDTLLDEGLLGRGPNGFISCDANGRPEYKLHDLLIVTWDQHRLQVETLPQFGQFRAYQHPPED